MPTARVILATYNQVSLLRLVLRGYLRQSTCDFTLVLADDGSGPEQTDFIESMVPVFAERGVCLELVWHEDDGWRKNCIMNEAVRRARDESLLIFSDADCVPPAHFVERHLAVHEPWSFHVAGGYRLDRETSEALTEEDIDRGSFESLRSEEDRKALQIRGRKSRWGTLVRRKNRPKVIGRNMGIDRRLFDAVNGFDEVFRWPYFGEDSDLRDRVMRHRPRPRVKVLYTENDVYHIWHPWKETRRNDHRDYYNQKRPMRCIKGLVDLSGTPDPSAELERS
jgi:glycosyltransferase involved in cell wall biosynthesis